MVKICITKIIKDGYDSYHFEVRGEATTGGNLRSQHEAIFGKKIAYEHTGVFSGIDCTAVIRFRYGRFQRDFEWKRLTGIDMPIKDVVNNLKTRIAEVKEWLSALPEDSEESLTFNI